MLGHGAIGQFAIGEVGAGTAETITVDKWFAPFSEPPRFKIGLRASAQQFSALSDPFPFVSFGWYEELSIPAVRYKIGLKASQQQFFAFQPAPSPFVATGWYVPLSEPPRFKLGLKASQQQFFASDTTAIPTSKLTPWFVPLSEPPRFKIGTYPPRQQFLAHPPQLRPTPTTTVVMTATESGDTFLGGVRVFLRVFSGEVGIIEVSFTGSQIGIIEQAFTIGTSGVIEQAPAPATGSPTATITTAHVGIREV